MTSAFCANETALQLIKESVIQDLDDELERLWQLQKTGGFSLSEGTLARKKSRL
eukprot:CAMPEP_0172519556 /NCGR_PEP_ID=MMETSP1066-20121228/291487_1 /TAXON_ID=671091 /ORGANISM="Coscinodiscus wailesii, Strain CCMP2513" /LENGTH=53 /DNA_ID=CAMNT_0013302163 /DNA_START=722 /DNA_END=883 /DNA_ORIENTATION=-